MGSHPANLAFRFVLEIAALVAVGRWGFRVTESWPRYLLVVSVPIMLAAAWGILAVPDDPSRSGNAPIPVAGGLRLCLELGIFALACWAFAASGARLAAWILAAAVVVHYALSYDRVIWLLSR
jgi:hypothetical protein